MARRGENIYKRKDGRYEGRYIKGRGEDGKAVYGYVYARRYGDVRTMLADRKTDIAQDGKPSLTLGQWLEGWPSKNAQVKDSTRLLYRRHIENTIIPEMGGVKLRELTADKVQRFINSLPMAPATVRLIFIILRSALREAQDRGLCEDVCGKVKLPQKAANEVEILTPAQQRKLEAALSDNNDAGILLCLYTGLRIGELCALKWGDVDFEKSALTVRGTQVRQDGELKITSPKTRTSARTIPVPGFIMERLDLLPRDGEFVLSNKGGPVEVRSYRRRFKRLLEEAGLPDIRFHALRHTFSSRALEVGMDYKTLSEVLGHASVSTTMDLYVHSLDDYKRSQMDKLQEIYAANSPSKSAVNGRKPPQSRGLA